MKKILLSVAIAGMTALTANAQNVNIPDANFKAYLVGNTAINTNNDTEIQVSEANTFTGAIICNGLSISDLTGIETFVALSELRCHANSLTSLNLTQNTSLTYLSCYGNNLTSLDVTQNTVLTVLSCHTNQLTALNVSENIALTVLTFSNNSITSMDASQNTSLETIICLNNALTYLNVANGNNTNVNQFNATGNPNLNCIEVDNVAYSTTNWTNIDGTASFSEDCSLSTGIDNHLIETSITFYPNPTKYQINFSIQTNAQLTSASGQIIKNRKNVTTLDLSGQPTGIYFLTLTDKEGQVVQRSKIVKE